MTDRKTVDISGGATSTYIATIISTSDYYPGGQVMPGRSTNSGSYRYAYNGMEVDNEVSGNGNSYTTEYRQYDPRLIRWKSLDPLKAIQPYQSPYQAFNNNPIYYTDPLGLIGGPAKNYDILGSLESDGGGGKSKGGFQYGTRLTSSMASPVIGGASGFILGAVTNSPNAKVANFVQYYKHHYQSGRNKSHRNMMIGAVGEGVAAENFEGAVTAYEGMSRSGKSFLPDFKTGLVRWNPSQSGTNPTGTWDFALSIIPNHAGSYDLMSAGADGVSMTEKSYTLERGKTLTFLVEVKTISPYGSYTKKNIERGADQAIKTAQLNSNNNSISILLMDEKAWTSAYSSNPAGMKRIHKKMTSAGVVLILVSNLNEDANCKLTEIWEGFKQAERDDASSVEAGEVTQEKIGP